MKTLSHKYSSIKLCVCVKGMVWMWPRIPWVFACVCLCISPTFSDSIFPILLPCVTFNLITDKTKVCVCVSQCIQFIRLYVCVCVCLQCLFSLKEKVPGSVSVSSTVNSTSNQGNYRKYFCLTAGKSTRNQRHEQEGFVQSVTTDNFNQGRIKSTGKTEAKV